VAKLFNTHYNIPVIDADIIARQLVEPGQPALLLIQQTFGKAIINKGGTLNRNKLRDTIFSDANKKQQLEAILHPLIYEKMQSQFDKQTSPYSILCIPLLMETGMTNFVDRILVIDCSVNTQIKRVTQRDQLSTDRILSIINSQVSRKYRLSLADDIIDNSNSDTQLAEQVKKLHNLYINL
ncbi:MAG: dephospho-CoA kinase, partial [Methylococcales bacterium]|nr:dephospho-CoA kinase [Methylococcales bacterium]